MPKPLDYRCRPYSPATLASHPTSGAWRIADSPDAPGAVDIVDAGGTVVLIAVPPDVAAHLVAQHDEIVQALLFALG